MNEKDINVNVGASHCHVCKRLTTWYKDKYNELRCYSCGKSLEEAMEIISNESVNHPKHYNSHPKNIECIDVVEEFSFNVGNAIKYLWQQGLKGDNIQDLEKAIWYVQREIEKQKKEKSK